MRPEILIVLFGIVFPHSFGKDCGPAEYKTNDECCPMCSRGSVVRKDCTVELSTSCIPCIKGTFMSEANGLTKCFLCSLCDPGEGLFTLRECTTTSDTVCDVQDGYYCKSYSLDSECSLAAKHTRCVKGQRTETQGTRSADTVCEECQQGYYSENGFNCTVWTDCAAKGQVKKEDGSSETDVSCKNAATRNHFAIVPPVGLLLLLGLLTFVCIIKEKEKGQSPNGGLETPKMAVPVQEVGFSAESS